MMEGSRGAGHSDGSGGEPPILVVEDDPHVRETIRWALEDEGMMVETAADGRQALEWASRRQPGLVVLDMGLPVVDGFGVASGLRESYGETLPILVVTADGRGSEKARRVGAMGFLSKPFAIDDLIDAVQRAMDQ